LLWDDDAHITRPELRSLDGLYRIWFDVTATQQYYPLSETAFWVQYKLWGEDMMGYHLTNIAFHALTAVMVALVLRQLAIARGISGGGCLCAASGARGIGGLDHGAEEYDLGRVLSGRGDGLFSLRPESERGLVLGGAGVVRAVDVRQDRCGDAAAALLVIFWWAAGKAVVAAGTCCR